MRVKTAFLRYRTEVVIFTVGAILFLGGLANVVISNRTTPTSDLDLRPDVEGPAALGVVGPGPDEDIGAYVARKKELLATRSAGAGREESFAVVSFDSYRTAGQAESFLAASKLDAHSLHVRVPLPGYSSESISVADGDIAASVDAYRQETLASLKEELSELEKIIPTVNDREFKRVYQEDAESRRTAISILEGEAPVVYGVVARGTHASLSKAGGVPGIRLVDVPDDPGVTPDTHQFRAIAPS